MGKLFGTDGVRGKANVELTPELAFNLGRAGAFVLTKHTDKKPKIILGMDTRISGDMLEAALTAGMTSVGASVYSAGVVPTPAIAYLVVKRGFDAGVMISASHNPFEDNGIKFVNSHGYKLDDSIEDEIEQYIFNGMYGISRSEGENLGTRHVDTDALSDYVKYLKSVVKLDDLSGLKIALDCANGATFKAAPAIFEQLGALVHVSHREPNGVNINSNCGSTHIESLVSLVKETGADVGFAFDGDGDRLITVDENGDILSGDMYMSIIGNYMKDIGTLRHNTIVSTVMANMGFSVMADKYDIHVESTNVGDRYVLERMLKHGYNFGGEQSGHVIFLDDATTGDGILSALKLCEVIKSRKEPLSLINNYMTVFPQVLKNAVVPNEKKYKYVDNEVIAEAIAALECAFCGRGRVLIRPSGTEPFVRVMIEGEDVDEIEREAARLVEIIEAEYN